MATTCSFLLHTLYCPILLSFGFLNPRYFPETTHRYFPETDPGKEVQLTLRRVLPITTSWQMRFSLKLITVRWYTIKLIWTIKPILTSQLFQTKRLLWTMGTIWYHNKWKHIHCYRLLKVCSWICKFRLLSI